MATNRGKQWEDVFKSDWERCFPKTFLLRLPDQMTGYKSTSANICDFIAFLNGTLYLLECKSHTKNTLPFTDIPQYERMLPYVGMNNIRAGVVVWFIDHENAIGYVPIATIKQMMSDGKKSIHINDFEDPKYRIIKIPAEKKRVFYTCDYSVLLNLSEND